MEQWYEDLINFIVDSSYSKRTIDLNEQKRNEHLNTLRKYLKDLVQALKNNDNTKIKEIKENILKEIKIINEKYRLHIDTLFNNNGINEQELSLALDLNYNKNNAPSKILRLKNYIEQLSVIEKINTKQDNFKKMQTLLIKQLEKLNEETSKETNLLERIFKRKNKKRKIQEIKNEIENQIDEIIIKIMPEKNIKLALRDIKNEINSKKPDIEAIINKTKNQMVKIKFFLASSLDKIKNTERVEIELPQDTISKHSTDQKSYLLNMEEDKKNNKNKYDLLIKVLITLKLLVEINKNEYKIVEQFKEYEKRKEEKQGKEKR